MRTPLIAFISAAVFLNCATLELIPASTCGNGVVDANEDCDSFPASCGKPADGVRACRLTCDRKVPGSCQPGWGCSVEGICRQATGAFDKAGVPSSAGAISLVTGDFDGDGRTDVVGGGTKGGSGRPRVVFYDSNGVPAAPVTVPFPIATAVVRDFDGDGRDDLAFGIESIQFGGFGLLAGTADRAFTPVLFPFLVRQATDTRAVAIPSDPAQGVRVPRNLPSALTLQRDATGTSFRSISPANLVGVPEFQAPATMGPEQVVGALVRGRVFFAESMDPPSACGEVVIPYNQGDVGHLAILSPCGAYANGPVDEVRWIARPPKDYVVCKDRGSGPCAPLKLTGPTEVVTLDGRPVIYVETGTPPKTTTLRAISNGVTLGPFEEVPAAPLVTGDLLGNGTTALVLPIGVFASSAPVTDGGAPAPAAPQLVPVEGATPAAGRWSDARIGRFNGDDLPDVVAMSQGALELELLANAGAGRFTRFSISSDQPVRAITTGDFDGDRIEDIAFLASSRPLGDAETTEVEARIAYGQANGGPEPPRLVGRFKHAVALTALHKSDKSVDDISVLESTPAASGLPTTTVTLLLNSGDRQSLAPLIMSDAAAKSAAKEDEIRVWLPSTLVAAPVFQADSVDVMALAFGLTLKADVAAGTSRFADDARFPTGLWLAKADKGVVGGLSSFKEMMRFDANAVNALDYGVLEKQGVFESVLVSAAADLDAVPDGISEVVTLSRNPRGSTDLRVFRGNEVAAANKAPTQITIGDWAVSGDDELSLVDVSGDGLPDAVVLTRSPLNADVRNREKLRVYLNDGKGSFDPKVIIVDIPKRAGDNDPNNPVGFARVVTGVLPSGRPRADLAVVTKNRLLLATLAADKTKFDVREVTELLGTPLSGHITSIASGDFDGDGVQDLAIADSGAVRLLRQQPRLR